MRRARGSIAVNLFLGLFASIAAVFLVFSYVSAKNTAGAWEKSFEEHASQTTAVTERVLRQGMLLRNKEAVHAALRDVASAPGIQAIRIYDKRGVVRFSTDPNERGAKVTRSAELCAVCHGDPFHAAALESATRTLKDERGAPVMAQATVIKNGESCAGKDCHASPSVKPYLGVMDFRTSMAAVEEANLRARRTTIWAAAVMALAGGVATLLLIWRMVRKPIVALVDATRAVAAGNLETRIELDQNREFQHLAHAFNHMTRDLALARDRAQQWEESLARAVEVKTAELATAHRRMAHMEKMASLGKLAAMVAHEVNNPLAGILVYAKLLQRELAQQALSEADRKEALRYVEVVRQESTRCGEIVKNLLSFARQTKNAFAEHHLDEIVQRSIMTVQHLFKTNAIDCQAAGLASDDLVTCDANEIQQALVALLVNAAEAMPHGGELRVRSERKGDDTIVLSVSDTGVGIAKEVMPEIFEPFFSTKGDEKGVGLGLAAVYGIVRRHEATIDVESEVGRGTTFRITLPRKPAPAKAVAPSRTAIPSDAGGARMESESCQP